MTPPTGQNRQSSNLLSRLIEKGYVTQEQADSIEKRVKRANSSYQQAIIDLGLATEETVYGTLAECSNLRFVRLSEEQPSEEANSKVSAKVGFHYKLVPLSLDNNTLTVAVSEPLTMHSREQLRMLLGIRLNPVIATPTDIHRTLKDIHGIGADTVMEIRKDKGFQQRAASISYEGLQSQDLESKEDAETASITRLVNQLLMEALELDATDIHIEPGEEDTRVRYRIDGMLREVTTPPGLRELHRSMVSRFKIMANLDIAEQRLPQDGRIRVRVGNEDFDLRVSILPTRFGETMCLRILSRSAIFLKLSELGLNTEHYNIMTQLVELPHGIVLVTGPTGSGKTTTLYSALARVRYSERKIITVEDPVEYQLDGISQIQIRSDIGLSFARGLRSILRHDPDIVLVGEIRDQETAEIAIRAALTGHLVLSTLHTNDAVGSVNRLIDMGIEAYLVSASLVAALAQRLVRRICRNCVEPDDDISELIREEIAENKGLNSTDVVAWRGAGCPECNDTGYKSRIAIYEIFVLDEELQDMVSENVPSAQLRREARRKGMNMMRDDGWDKVLEGITTIEEVTRITGRMKLAASTENQEDASGQEDSSLPSHQTEDSDATDSQSSQSAGDSHKAPIQTSTRK